MEYSHSLPACLLPSKRESRQTSHTHSDSQDYTAIVRLYVFALLYKHHVLCRLKMAVNGCGTMTLPLTFLPAPSPHHHLPFSVPASFPELLDVQEQYVIPDLARLTCTDDRSGKRLEKFSDIKQYPKSLTHKAANGCSFQAFLVLSSHSKSFLAILLSFL